MVNHFIFVQPVGLLAKHAYRLNLLAKGTPAEFILFSESPANFASTLADKFKIWGSEGKVRFILSTLVVQTPNTAFFRALLAGAVPPLATAEEGDVDCEQLAARYPQNYMPVDAFVVEALHALKGEALSFSGSASAQLLLAAVVGNAVKSREAHTDFYTTCLVPCSKRPL